MLRTGRKWELCNPSGIKLRDLEMHRFNQSVLEHAMYIEISFISPDHSARRPFLSGSISSDRQGWRALSSLLAPFLGRFL